MIIIKMEPIKDIINNLIDIIIKYGKFIIFVICVTSIIPITFYIWLLSMGFLSSGITLGSSAALWMASLGNVPVGSIFTIVQSISTRGIWLFLHPYLLFIECIFSLCFGIYVGYKYDFSVDKIINEFKLYVPYFIMILNNSFSVIIDGIIGIIISIIIIFILYLLFLAISSIINHIKKKINGHIVIGNHKKDKKIPIFIIFILILITIIFILLSLLFGIYLGYKYPFEIIKI